ncbi:helix-turn-helix domain-containing protein [Kitasatospora sp. NPDC057692]|uniref:helix-turn-helix domain-containing protein n=1 Tax=Kitasatospora sp. NPDC057692 TaxID=3346215 RepID=UPI003680D853
MQHNHRPAPPGPSAVAQDPAADRRGHPEQGQQRAAGTDGPAATAPRPLDAVRARFARNPADPRAPAATAALLGLAPRTLQRALAAAGTSHQAQLLAVRLDVAGHLTARTSLPLADIAATAGFTDHAHLTRRFHAHYGCPPSEFRRAGHH